MRVSPAYLGRGCLCWARLGGGALSIIQPSLSYELATNIAAVADESDVLESVDGFSRSSRQRTGSLHYGAVSMPTSRQNTCGGRVSLVAVTSK